jgi:hypothetical protein
VDAGFVVAVDPCAVAMAEADNVPGVAVGSKRQEDEEEQKLAEKPHGCEMFHVCAYFGLELDRQGDERAKYKRGLTRIF